MEEKGECTCQILSDPLDRCPPSLQAMYIQYSLQIEGEEHEGSVEGSSHERQCTVLASQC